MEVPSKTSKEVSLRQSLYNKLLFSLAFAALIYLGFLLWSGWQDFVNELEDFPLLCFLPVLLLSCGNYITRYIKFDIYLKTLGYHIPRLKGLAIFLAGLAGTVTPGKLGEVLKSLILERDCNAPISKTAPIVIAERLTDLAALILITLVGLREFNGSKTPIMLGGAMLIAVLMIISWKSLCDGILDKLEAKEGVIGKLGSKLRKAYLSTETMLSPIDKLLIPIIISLLSWFFECLGFSLVLWAFGVEISLAKASFIYCFATLDGALAMLPGGLGATEAIMIALLSQGGVDKATAAASTLIIRACTLWFAVLVGALSLASLSRSSERSGF